MPVNNNNNENPVWYSLILPIFPAALYTWAGFSSWAIAVRYVWNVLIIPNRNDLGLRPSNPPTYSFAAGATILVCCILFKILWILPALYLQLTSLLSDRSGWKFSPTVMKNKRIMQIDTDKDPHTHEIFLPQSERYRDCPKCSSHHPDRVYPTDGNWGFQQQRCLPLYDHFCGLLFAHVYLRTIKPYLHTLFFLSLDLLFNLAISIFILVNFEAAKETPIYGIALAFTAFITILLWYFQGWPVVRRIALHNQVLPETIDNNYAVAFAVPVSRTESEYHVLRLGRNPWDLGLWNNLHEALGEHWYQWLVFFLPATRIKTYGRNKGQWDCPFGQHVLERDPFREASFSARRSRRSDGRSTGFELP